MVHKLSVATPGPRPAAFNMSCGPLDRTLASDPSNSAAGGISLSEQARWSARQTVAFLLAVNGVSWIGLAAVLKAVL